MLALGEYRPCVWPSEPERETRSAGVAAGRAGLDLMLHRSMERALGVPLLPIILHPTHSCSLPGALWPGSLSLAPVPCVCVCV